MERETSSATSPLSHPVQEPPFSQRMLAHSRNIIQGGRRDAKNTNEEDITPDIWKKVNDADRVELQQFVMRRLQADPSIPDHIRHGDYQRPIGSEVEKEP